MTFLRPQDWQSCLRFCDASIAGNILLLLASHDNPAASAVASDSAVADVIAAVGFPWVLAVEMVSVVAGEPAGVFVLTVVAVQGAPAVVKVSGVSVVTTAVDALPATVVSNVSSVPAVVGVPAVAGNPAVDGVLTVEHPFFSCFYCSCVPAIGIP